MSELDRKIIAVLERALGKAEDGEARPGRLLEDTRRLCARTRGLLEIGLPTGNIDRPAIELACYALALPLRPSKGAPAVTPSRLGLRARALEAAELLDDLLGEVAGRKQLDQVMQILRDMSEQRAKTQEARLLADAVNLDDFGVIGMIQQTLEIARQGAGVEQLSAGCQKREQYGYWGALLKDGFNFDQVRQIAVSRLEHARKVAAMLSAELNEDQGAK